VAQGERTEQEIRSAAYAAVGLLHSIAHWPHAARQTPELASLLVGLVSEGLASLRAVEPAAASRRRT